MSADTTPARSDLTSRSWTALAIGIALLVLGAVMVDGLGRSLDPSTVATFIAFGSLPLGAMTVQAAIVGFVFGSYDGIRRPRRAAAGPDDPAPRRAAGWYEDPEQPGVSRWWDGWDWTATRTDEQA